MVTKTTKVAKPADVTSNTNSQRNYELMLIISPEFGEDKLNVTVSNISQLITGPEGTPADIKQLGKRKLAYPIKHFGEGHYVIAHFKMNSEASPQVEARLNITEEILRYLLIRLD